MRSISIKSAADVAMLVPSLIGFEPDESIVVLGVGGAPIARVDIPGPTVAEYAELASAFSAPVQHWRTAGVLIVAYTADPALFDYWIRHGSATLPGVELIDMIRVHDGKWYAPFDTEGTPFVSHADPEVASSREVLVAEAQQVESADEAERLAITAWHKGDGARAWCFYDRAVVLAGQESDHMCRLALALAKATNPHTTTCDEFGLPIEDHA